MNHDELYKALCKVPNGKEKSRDKIIIGECPSTKRLGGEA